MSYKTTSKLLEMLLYIAQKCKQTNRKINVTVQSNKRIARNIAVHRTKK